MVRGTGFYNFASFFLSACVKKSCPFLHLSNALSCSGSATKTIITKSEQRICYLEISVQERYFKKVIFKKRSVRDIDLLKSLFNPELWNLKCNSLFFQRPNCFQNIVFFFILLVPLAFHICMLHLLAFPFSVYHATHHVRACTRLKYFIAEPVFFKLKLYERVTFVINNILNKLFMKLKLSANYFTRKNCF